MSRHNKMLLGIAVGALLGLLVNKLAEAGLWPGWFPVTWLVDYVSHPIGQIFLRLLLMLVIPLLFSAIVIGVCDLDLRHLGRLGARTLGYTAVVSTIAVVIGLVLVNVIAPGAGVDPSIKQYARPVAAQAGPADASAIGLIIAIIPSNPIAAAAGGDVIAWLAFSVIFAIGLALTHTDGALALRKGIGGIFDVSMRLIEGVLKLAPVGVAALLFTMTARLGTGILAQLAAYVGVVLFGLVFHMFVVYSLSVRFLGRRSPVAFFRDSRLAILTAFSTASSNATLPTALKVAEERLRLPRHVSRFVLTAGATMNQNGTALFEGVTVLFLAQLYGVPLAIEQQLLVMIVCVLAGIGTAGVPAGSLPVIAMIVTMLGIPPESVGLILGVDRFLDMCRTTVNVTGDLAAAVYVSLGEEGRSEPSPPTAPEPEPQAG